MSNLLEQASLVMIPSGYAEDIVYSEIPLDGSGDLQFTRASNGTRINSAGLVEVCPWNLLQYSEDFSNAIWTITGGATITTNTTTAPNGTTTADTFAVANGQYLYQFIAAVAGQSYTISVYFKVASGTKQFKFNTYGSGNDFTSSAITVTTEWQRFEYTFTAVGSGTTGIYPAIVDGLSSASFFIWGAQLNIGSTAKPYFPTTDRLNVPRLTYQNGGGGCPSLLLEKQSTNYLKYSNDFTQSVWSASGSITRTANYAVSPDGTQTATRIQWNGTDGELYQYLGQTTPTRSSVYVKGTAGQVINFCLNLITLTGEWQRIEAASLIDGSDTWFGIITKSSVGHTATDFLLWGGQGENGTYATSLISTTSASATRVADACYKTGISSLIGQTSGSVFFDFTVDSVTQPGDPVLWYMKDGGAGERYVELYSNGNLVYAEIDGSGPIATITKSSLTVGRHKCAIAYATNDFVFYVDGVQIGTDTSGTPNGFSTFGLQYYLSVYTGQQKVNQAAIFKTRLTNAELASLTTI